MANTIQYVVDYLNMLDGINKKELVTGDLQVNPLAVRFSSSNPKTIEIKSFAFEGLGDYDRSAGYDEGDFDITWTPYTLTHDRGKKMILDTLDSKEALTTILEAAAEFTRTKVVPEVDAIRFATMAQRCGVDVSGSLTLDTVLESIDTAIQTLDDAECPSEGRILYVSNETYKLMKNSGEFFNTRISSQNNGVINRDIMMFDNMRLVRVPSGRFYTKITLSATNGYAKAVDGKDINFAIAHAGSVAAVTNYVAPKIVEPAQNNSADAYIFGYRMFHDLIIPDNKLSNIYIHAKA